MNGLILTTVLAITVNISDAKPYNDTFARTTILPLAAAAYSGSPQNCLYRHFPNATLSGTYTVHCDNATQLDRCFGYIAVDPASRAVIVSFRGARGAIQDITAGIETLFEAKIATPFGGEVSAYFWNAFIGLWNAGLYRDFVNATSKHQDYAVWITGHSLGGAIASIAAAHIVHLNYTASSNVVLYTLGQPRTGDFDFACTHDRLLPDTYRIVHNRDIVPHLPSRAFEGYFHHAQEVWYSNSMAVGDPFIVCNSGESPNCSNSDLFTTSFIDHGLYFTDEIDIWGQDGC